MARVHCPVCQKMVDSRGMNGHLRTHPDAVKTADKEMKLPLDLNSYRLGYRNGMEDAKKSN